MKYILRTLLLISVSFLLWYCGETTDPIQTTPAQTEWLLTGGNEKSWVRYRLENKSTKDSIPCSSKPIFKFINENDSTDINSADSSCGLGINIIKTKYSIKLTEGQTVLKFGNYLKLNADGINKDVVTGDTIFRKIISITDKEFVTESYSNKLSLEVVEKFRPL